MEANHTYLIQGSKEYLMDVFCDLPKFCEFHPLIISSKFLKKDSAGRAVYGILEKPFSFLPVKVKYQASATINKDTVEYDIRKIPLMHPILTYTFNEIDTNSTELFFDIKIVGLPLVKNYLGYKMKKAMDELVANLPLS